jgi:purine-binding chemotaxis protein CheW
MTPTETVSRSNEVLAVSSTAGKYLTFALSQERYGVQILKVQEIIGLMNITRVPRCPSYLKGIINLRGKIIPVVDLRLVFGLEEAAHDARTCIIVVEMLVEDKAVSVGVIVDTVLEVRAFSADQIEASPDYGVNLNAQFILGMGRGEDNQVIILVDIDKALREADPEVGKALAGTAS